MVPADYISSLMFEFFFCTIKLCSFLGMTAHFFVSTL